MGKSPGHLGPSLSSPAQLPFFFPVDSPAAKRFSSSFARWSHLAASRSPSSFHASRDAPLTAAPPWPCGAPAPARAARGYISVAGGTPELGFPVFPLSSLRRRRCITPGPPLFRHGRRSKPSNSSQPVDNRRRAIAPFFLHPVLIDPFLQSCSRWSESSPHRAPPPRVVVFHVHGVPVLLRLRRARGHHQASLGEPHPSPLSLDAA